MPFILDPGKKIPKKIGKKLKKLKNHFPTFFLAKMGCDRPRKREKNSLSDIIFEENRMRQAEKGGKKFYSRMPFMLDPGKKIPKKIVKKLKKLKNLIPNIFSA